MATQLVPYIFFYGRCAEALEFYKSVFGGSYEMMRVGETPVASQMPPDAANSVMHASFTADGIAFMASDGRDVKPVDPDAGNISVALALDDAARGERIFNALAAGGTVGMPIDAAFWGGRFGMVVDKFGTEWMVTLP
ncbi:MAG: glyoxalase/Bleomycin resistance/Dioxygenase superfamily protein [Candidatus Eremiobacteraeota bacterium]|nr:glyoxalase/Bleomycin resistance/Dioxygenase superfamily protein [Candidatus Eremiobacteraeota bacterium]